MHLSHIIASSSKAWTPTTSKMATLILCPWDCREREKTLNLYIVDPLYFSLMIWTLISYSKYQSLGSLSTFSLPLLVFQVTKQRQNYYFCFVEIIKSSPGKLIREFYAASCSLYFLPLVRSLQPKSDTA